MWLNLVAAVWVVILGSTTSSITSSYFWHKLGSYIWCALGSIGLIAWGLFEKRSERINLGIAGFALTVTVFYFSNVMDKLDRAASLIGLGALFLAGGWFLEHTRRGLLARITKEST